MRTELKPNRLAHSAKIGADAYDINHREWLLDEALNDTFPASDPPSIAWPQ